MNTGEMFDYRYTEEDKPMTPAHAGGAMGELDSAFVLGQRGFGIAIGPGGPGGHRLTASGFDIVAYNPKTDRVWIVDNKASGGTSTVQDATAITKNLEPNLVQAVQQIRSARDFPHKQTIVRHLESALNAVRSGQPLPPTVERYITNAGGYHSGISSDLKRKGVQFLDVTGAATRTTRKQDIKTAKQQGVPTGRPTTHQKTGGAGGTGGQTPSTPPTRTPGSTRVATAAGLQIGLAGLNYVLNWLNDREQQRRLQEQLARIEPAIQAERQRQPDHGILILVYYHQVQAPPDSMIQPGAVFSHLAWESGRSQDEALQKYQSRATISAAPTKGSVQHVTRIWIQPLQPSSVMHLQPPFPQVGYGVFVPGSEALQDVKWGGVRGFDDDGQSYLGPIAIARATALGARQVAPGQPLPPAVQIARFLILKSPTSINWVWGQQVRSTSIPTELRYTAAFPQTVEVVELDPHNPFGDVAAVPVFPYDTYTDNLFRSGPPTRDNLNQLRLYLNIKKMRWVRPENIKPVPRF